MEVTQRQRNTPCATARIKVQRHTLRLYFYHPGYSPCYRKHERKHGSKLTRMLTALPRAGNIMFPLTTTHYFRQRLPGVPVAHNLPQVLTYITRLPFDQVSCCERLQKIVVLLLTQELYTHERMKQPLQTNATTVC